MLTDGTAQTWDGVRDVADQADRRGDSLVTTILLGLLVFGIGLVGGFIARLLWPRAR